jgi:hypothetical protein
METKEENDKNPPKITTINMTSYQILKTIPQYKINLKPPANNEIWNYKKHYL